MGAVYWVRRKELDAIDPDWRAKPWFQMQWLEPKVTPQQAKMGLGQRWPVWQSHPSNSKEPTLIGMPRFLGQSLFGRCRLSNDRRVLGKPMAYPELFSWGDSKPRPP